MGLYIDTPFRVFPDGFPQELISQIEAFSGRKVIGNKPASGTEIIKELGEEQLKTGALIVYTSAISFSRLPHMKKRSRLMNYIKFVNTAVKLHVRILIC